ncbi:MAG: alpha-mannosidase [Capsulimonadaceae bacterium]|nr:alpha-mannosidase [Capsulimonadaceae bacterium]
MSWHYTEEKIARQIKDLFKAVVRASVPLPAFRVTRATGPAPDVLREGDSYNAEAETVALETRVEIPSGWAGQRVYVALKLVNAESLAYVDGVPTQAIDRYHHDLLLTECATAGEAHEIKIEAYTGLVETRNAEVFLGLPTKKSSSIKVELDIAQLQWIDRDAEGLYFDLSVALGALKTFDKASRHYSILLDALDKTVNLLDFRYSRNDPRFYESAVAAGRFFHVKYLDKYAADPEFTPVMRAVGHAHIDTAWLWPLAHTRKKVGRTFSTQVTLGERYKDLGYVFTCSQPQQYAYLKEDYPEVFERVKNAIDNGSWETVGGMWVEADCNIASGEALVRQFLYGQRFLKREFGDKAKNEVVWLPDVFGYTASFPQIIKKAGMKYFMTIKIYWSQINKPLYQTFDWEGIDGTTVLTHFSPGGDYNATMEPEQISRFWGAYNEKKITDTGLYIFGHGDGGGGPTRKMLENARRLQNFPNSPRIQNTTAQAFFEELEKQVEGNPMLPRWVGELYLELHRGTYTSQGRNKRGNRQSEIALQTAEQLASLALVTTGASYPHDAIDRAWELTLLNQFHDIIPGSSIHAVYEDSDRDYARILSAAGETSSSALGAIAGAIDAAPGSVVVYNPLSWKRDDYAALPRSLGASGQKVTGIDGEALTLVHAAATQPLGYSVLAGEPSHSSDGEISVTAASLENRFFRIAFDENSEIVSIFDKNSNREVVDKSSYCKGNSLLMFEDKPMNWDAWDVDIFYQDKVYPLTEVESVAVIEKGPLRGTIEVVRKFGRGSTITQRISVWRDLPRIDFDTLVDWQERQMMLKAAFPVLVHASSATYDIQFGNVVRPTHWNTTWDWARFEVCAHKWADLSEGGEGGYGVSLLSDCKYGWDIKGNVMRLTLLKGPVAPDPDADLGMHRFTYSLYPHAGDWRAAQTVRRAYELNVPIKAAKVTACGNLPSSLSLVHAEQENLVIETLKKAEDENALIVRFYEAYGRRGTGALSFCGDVASACEVNLMEEHTPETVAARIDVAGPNVSFDFAPYEIKTLKVVLKA